MLGINVVAAATDGEARFLATSGRQSFASLRRGMPTTLPPPNPDFEKDVVPFGRIPLEEATSIAMVGSPATVHDGIRRFVAQTTPDELIVVSHIYDHAARLRSYEIVAELIESLGSSLSSCPWSSAGPPVPGLVNCHAPFVIRHV